MTWKQLKELADKLGVKDSDEIGIYQNKQFSTYSKVASIKKERFSESKWLLEDSHYEPEYQTTGFDRQ